MSDHSIVWTFDRDTVDPKVICEATEGAPCRLGPEDNAGCQCDEWLLQREPDGRPFHIPEGGDEKHYMTDAGECQVALFLDGTYPIEEGCSNKETFEIGRTPIEPVWEGDYYDWERVTA